MGEGMAVDGSDMGGDCNIETVAQDLQSSASGSQLV